MSLRRELKPNIYAVGVIDWERRLFDELIPLPDGTSYNAYMVKGIEKTALIDTVDPTMADVLVRNLEELETENIDYVIVNHAEQDHSGALPEILGIYPGAKVVCTPKCKDMLMDLLLIPENKFITVADGETLPLGNKTLEFIHAPWVHWPETMLTYLREDKMLFTCDFLGSHIATSDLFVKDEAMVYEAAKRYYAEIMMPFRPIIRKNLEKIKDLPIDIIAPSHGPAYDKPDFILNAYRDWASDEVKNEVIIPYISMHGSTKKMVDYFAERLIERGITIKQFDLSEPDIGKLAMALVDAATVVIGSPTVLVGPHPKVVYAACLANALRPKLKFVSIIGSYGWGSRMVEQLAGMITSLKVEILDPVVVKGVPKEEDFIALDKLADEIVNKHREHNIIKAKA
ncbi:MAG: Type A flavoprotein FprA [Candidatus Argoarchaeum ethanivorans]|uniref:Type A flavoprotein FprA n=1 Tax=Candidatus Argoarchaeum ethanivorans TaxID=2608793 RepID=A0A811T9F0_9EURY|nr:MAG: Type A flavoprotein FprA [Candidatus Argoarchaeum ethanivorans]